jgi:hypothetical protein
MAGGKIYIANTNAVVSLEDGSYITLSKDTTRVREGHPLLKGRESMFRELDVHYELEDARSAPEERKAVPVPTEDQPQQAAGDKPPGPAGLTSESTPGAVAPKRGRQRTTRTD